MRRSSPARFAANGDRADSAGSHLVFDGRQSFPFFLLHDLFCAATIPVKRDDCDGGTSLHLEVQGRRWPSVNGDWGRMERQRTPLSVVGGDAAEHSPRMPAPTLSGGVVVLDDLLAYTSVRSI